MADQEQGGNPFLSEYKAQQAAQDPSIRSQVENPGVRQRMDAIDLGFAQAGAEFSGGDPAAAAAWRQYGSNITGVMQQRWFQKEFESFEGQYLQPYTERIRSIDSSLTEKFGQADSGTIVGPDGSVMPMDPNSRDAARYKSNLLAAHAGEMSKATDDLLSATTKYGAGNPLIQARIQSIMQAHTDQIGQLTNPQQLIAGEKGFADVASAQQDVPLKESMIAENRARASLLNRTDPNLRSESGAEWERISGDPEQYLAAYGPAATASRLMSTGGAKAWMATDYDGALASIESEMRDRAKSDKKFAKSVGFNEEGVLLDEERFKAELGRRSSEAMSRAAAEFAQRMGNPDLLEELKKRPGVAQYLGDEETPEREIEYKVPGILSEDEEESRAKQFSRNAISVLEERASSGEITSEKQLIEEAKKLLGGQLRHANTPGARKQARDLEQKILDEIGLSWGESGILRKALNAPNLPDIAGRAKKKVTGIFK